MTALSELATKVCNWADLPFTHPDLFRNNAFYLPISAMSINDVIIALGQLTEPYGQAPVFTTSTEKESYIRLHNDLWEKAGKKLLADKFLGKQLQNAKEKTISNLKQLMNCSKEVGNTAKPQILFINFIENNAIDIATPPLVAIAKQGVPPNILLETQYQGLKQQSLPENIILDILATSISTRKWNMDLLAKALLSDINHLREEFQDFNQIETNNSMEILDLKSFSNRYGYQEQQSEIKIRQDAPDNLRWYLLETFYNAKKLSKREIPTEGLSLKPSDIRRIVCHVLKKRPDKNNWTENPNIENEVAQLVAECPWYKVYEIIEAICNYLPVPENQAYSDELNQFFKDEGIGWQIQDGKVEYRDQGFFEELSKTILSSLEGSGKNTAKTQLQEAYMDLSRRPEPDITGAVQHAVASLECFMRDYCGNKKATLGELLKKHPGIIPNPLDKAVEKSWGYASERGRHLNEGYEISLEEAELIVHTCTMLISYLSKKINSQSE